MSTVVRPCFVAVLIKLQLEVSEESLIYIDYFFTLRPAGFKLKDLKETNFVICILISTRYFSFLVIIVNVQRCSRRITRNLQIQKHGKSIQH